MLHHAAAQVVFFYGIVCQIPVRRQAAAGEKRDIGVVLRYGLFGDLPDIWSVLGYILICGAGVAMFFYNKRKEG